jgi:hypothetical protein
MVMAVIASPEGTTMYAPAFKVAPESPKAARASTPSTSKVVKDGVLLSDECVAF